MTFLEIQHKILELGNKFLNTTTPARRRQILEELKKLSTLREAKRKNSNHMTLDEMKLAVCEKLPELITICEELPCVPAFFWNKPAFEGHQINWPTEGLQVCHEAERILIADPLYNEGLYYSQALRRITESDETTDRWQWNATYSHRLEALCRVWYPERF